MRKHLFLLTLSIGFMASTYAQERIGGCTNPPCAPAKCDGIDPYSGQAQITCANTNSFNCTQTSTLTGEVVSPMDFEIGKPGIVTYQDVNGRPVTMTFTAFGGIKKVGKTSVITFGGAKVK